MNGKFRIILTGLVVALLAACASTPQQRFASSVKAAQAANRPLVIYGFGTDYTRTGNIENFVFDNHEFGAQQGLAVINTASKPIQKLAFTIEYYHKSRPALDQDGQPIAWTLIADGPLAPGSSRFVVETVPKPIVLDRLASGCPHLVGIQGEYADGSTFEVDSHNASRYLTPQINVNCIYYYGSYPPFPGINPDTWGPGGPAPASPWGPGGSGSTLPGVHPGSGGGR